MVLAVQTADKLQQPMKTFTEEEDALMLWASKQKKYTNTSTGKPLWNEIAKHLNRELGVRRQGKDIHQRITRVLLAANPKQKWTEKGLLKLHHLKHSSGKDGYQFLTAPKYFPHHTDLQLRYQYEKKVTSTMVKKYNAMSEEEKEELVEYTEPFVPRTPPKAKINKQTKTIARTKSPRKGSSRSIKNAKKIKHEDSDEESEEEEDEEEVEEEDVPPPSTPKRSCPVRKATKRIKTEESEDECDEQDDAEEVASTPTKGSSRSPRKPSIKIEEEQVILEVTPQLARVTRGMKKKLVEVFTQPVAPVATIVEISALEALALLCTESKEIEVQVEECNILVKLNSSKIDEDDEMDEDEEMRCIPETPEQ